MNRLLLLLPLLLLAACQTSATGDRQLAADRAAPAPWLPKDGRVLLILGQDLDSVAAYRDSGSFPQPGGVTTYLAFYNLLRDTHPVYGGLGEDPAGKPLAFDVDWGAGRVNAHSSAYAYPGSALVLGLNIAEGSGDAVWTPGGLARIGRGDYDDEIRRLAKFCRDVAKPVYLRIGYEFDGAWNRGYENRADYITAWRRIVDGLRAAGAINVASVWQASAAPVDDLIDGRREDIREWYPGDDYVDWMGLSWFLPAARQIGAAPTQQELAREVVEFARARGKPVMITEAAPQGYDLEKSTRSAISPLLDGPAGELLAAATPRQIWQQWFTPFFDFVRDNADAVRAVAYINADWDAQPMWAPPYAQGYWGDTRVQSNPAISEYWLREISDETFWLHGGPGIAAQLSP